jgi:hypothetical protein
MGQQAKEGMADAAVKAGHALVAFLNESTPFLVGVGILGCAVAVMLTGDTSKWLGRACWLFWVGAAWMILFA